MPILAVNDLSLSVCADALQYPAPDLHERLALSVHALPPGPLRQALQTFLAQMALLSLGEWEELYTRTWDLDPLTPPYIGFHIWGEDYRRGNFLTQMQAACRQAGVETGGELPDHLAPVLRCIAAGFIPDELGQVFNRALEKMAARLREKDSSNPYLGLIEALEGQKI